MQGTILSMRSTRASRTPVPMLLAAAACILLLLVLACWILAGWSPGWFNPVAEDDIARANMGEQVEFRLAEELQKIRPSGERWRLRITDEAINAWLSTRLGPWLSHQPSIQWPDGLSRPQIRFRTRGIDVGIRIEDILGSDRVVVLSFHPSIRDGQIDLRPGWVRLGRLPIPFGRTAMDARLRQMLPQLEGSAGSLIKAALGDAAMEAMIPLVDDRRVRVEKMALEPGAIILEASTLPAR